MRALAALLLCCFSAALHAEAPARIEANFDVRTRGIKIAEIREVFIRTGDSYRIESITKLVGLLALFKPDTLQVVSEGSIVAEGLRPGNYVYKHTHETSKNTGAYFDWEQSSLLLSDRHGQHLKPLPPGLQDRLSMQYQFRHIPSLGEREDVTMYFTNGSKISKHRYLIRDGQTTEVPLGTLKTLYLSSPPKKDSHKKIEVWLSVENGNFPCKIVVTEDDGGVLTQVLTGLSITQ